MAYDNDRLKSIYGKTDGRCHICHKKLSYSNYGIHGSNGSWHVEHSRPKARGGSNHLNNLYAACIRCNCEKGILHTKTARAWNGNSRAPYNASKKKQIKTDNTIGGMILGGLFGALLGPGGAVLGATIGGAIANNNSPKR